MSPLEDSKAIFLQLADTDGSLGVQTIIENHDAWSHGVAAVGRLNAAVRAQVAHTGRAAGVAARISRQQGRLGELAVSLPRVLPAAG